MKNKKKIILIALLIVVVLVVVLLLVFNRLATNTLEVEQTISLVEKQGDLEDNFTSEGYTIDNPNIIVNPYEISPLTALVIFETDEEVSPTITVVGKDEHSTFTHTFDANTVHYLPIYGLYADTSNEVVISYGDVEKRLEIKTEALPDDFIMPTSVEAQKSMLDNELYFFTPSSSGYTCAYDVNGDVRWYLTINAL